jgi:hypothetical protein
VLRVLFLFSSRKIIYIKKIIFSSGKYFIFSNVLFIAVELVDRREVMLGQDVVDPFLPLLDAGLSGGLEHVGEEILEVLVRQELLGRDEVVLVLWIPLELVDPRETTRMQRDL